MAAGASSASGGGLGGSAGADGGDALSNGGQPHDGDGYADGSFDYDAGELQRQLQQLAQGQDSLRSFLTEHPLLGDNEQGDGFDEYGDGFDGELPGGLDPEAPAGLEDGVPYTVGEDGSLQPDTNALVQQQVAETLGQQLQPVHDAMSRIVGEQHAQQMQQAATELASLAPELQDPDTANAVMDTTKQIAQRMGVDSNSPQIFELARIIYLAGRAEDMIREEAESESVRTAHVEGGAGGGGGQRQPAGFLETISRQPSEGLGANALPFQRAQTVAWDDRYHHWNPFLRA